MITIAKYIAEFLSKKGIKLLPVYQGGAVMHLIDAVGENRKLDYFVPYHEQALSMQVDTMSRLNGFGAGMATSGPGATNLLTGVCSAFYDSIPCFYFTGQVGQIHLKQNRGVRQLGFQETDVYNIFKPITKYCVQINDPKTIRDFVDINLLARDARALRKYIREIAPDTDLVFNFEGDGGYTEENVEIPIGANFFWPDAAI